MNPVASALTLQDGTANTIPGQQDRAILSVRADFGQIICQVNPIVREGSRGKNFLHSTDARPAVPRCEGSNEDREPASSSELGETDSENTG